MRPKTIAEIATGSYNRRAVHRARVETPSRVIAVCRPSTSNGFMTLNDKKVTCKRCLHILAGGTETERRAQLAALEARAALHTATLELRRAARALQDQARRAWQREGGVRAAHQARLHVGACRRHASNCLAPPGRKRGGAVKAKSKPRVDRRVRCPHNNRITPGNDGPCGCRVTERSCVGCVHAPHGKRWCGKSYLGAGGCVYSCGCIGVACTGPKASTRPMLGLELTSSL